MKLLRFNTISSLPSSMKLETYTSPNKVYEPSIVDKTCFTPLTEQLKGLQPMTMSEAIQHYDFVNGKDDGREMPLHKGADISEISTDIRNKQESISKRLDKAAQEIAKEAEHKALQEKVKSEISEK